MRILLTGRNGQLGWELQRSLQGLGEVIATDRRVLDLSDAAQITRVVRAARPQIIVNAAAYTAVDMAESEEALALAINAAAPAVMAESARECGALLIHYSTDYIFDGQQQQPYIESQPARPVNAYGRSKAEGERLIRQIGGRYLILRSAWIFGAHGRNFLLTVLRLAREQARLRIVADQLGSPSWSRSIADTTASVMRQLPTNANVQDTLHLTGKGVCSWHELARRIVQIGFERGLCPLTPVDPITAAEFPSAANRPAYSVLDGSRLQQRYGLQLPHWRDALESCLDELGRTVPGFSPGCTRATGPDRT